MYEFNALIPGRSTVRIELWDWNKILKDELIGYTLGHSQERISASDISFSWENYFE